MRLAGIAIAWGMMVGCAFRKAGPHRDETVAWVIESAEVVGEGCDEATPIVDAVERTYGAGSGFVYRTGPEGTTADSLSCPLQDGAFVLEACEPDGVVGTVDGHETTFVSVETVIDEGPCTFTLSETRAVTDDGFEGALLGEIAVDATDELRCGYTFEGVGVRPDGCVVAIDAVLTLADSERR